MTPGEKGRILAIEDDAAVRGWLAVHLQRAGYQVFAAKTVREARTLTASTKPDVVILDLGLPDGSGLIAKGPIKEIRLDGLDWQ